MKRMLKVYRRRTTLERRVSLGRNTELTDEQGENFRIEVKRSNSNGDMTVFAREHTGRIEVEELTDGNFRVVSSF